jgi:hypothetical protein
MTKTIEARQKMERAIVRRVVKDALKLGYALSVDDGGDEYTVTESRDGKAVLAALMQTDEDHLILNRDGVQRGWVRFVYGNDGWDVICDYSVRVEDAVVGAEALAERLEGR